MWAYSRVCDIKPHATVRNCPPPFLPVFSLSHAHTSDAHTTSVRSEMYSHLLTLKALARQWVALETANLQSLRSRMLAAVSPLFFRDAQSTGKSVRLAVFRPCRMNLSATTRNLMIFGIPIGQPCFLMSLLMVSMYSRTPLIRPPSESHWCGRIRGMVAREGFVYEQKPLSVTRNVVV